MKEEELNVKKKLNSYSFADNKLFDLSKKPDNKSGEFRAQHATDEGGEHCTKFEVKTSLFVLRKLASRSPHCAKITKRTDPTDLQSCEIVKGILKKLLLVCRKKRKN